MRQVVLQSRLRLFWRSTSLRWGEASESFLFCSSASTPTGRPSMPPRARDNDALIKPTLLSADSADGFLPNAAVAISGALESCATNSSS
jgi:hypothetical protein